MTESLKEQRVHPVRPWSSCCYKMQVGMSRRHLDQKDQPKHMETVRMDPFMDGCVARCCLLVHVLSTEYGVHTPAQCKSQGSGSAFHAAARRSRTMVHSTSTYYVRTVTTAEVSLLNVG